MISPLTFWHRFLRLLSQPRQDALLRTLLSGKRVLILGSGPSAAELSSLPSDVLILSCNTAPEMLLKKNLRTRVDLYIGNRTPLEEYGDRIDELFTKLAFNYFLTRSPGYIEKRGDVHFQKLLLDRGSENSNYLLRRLIDHATVEKIIQSAARGVPSTGVNLLIHALVYGAKEIYLIGMDMDTKGHAIGDHKTEEYAKTHQNLDHEIVRFATKKFDNIYSASATSPVTSLIPYRALA